MSLIEAHEEKGRYLFTWKRYIGDVVEDNRREQQREQKIRDGAFGRKIGSIPVTVYRAWEEEFEGLGYKTQSNFNDDWKAFLRRKLDAHPEFRTVDKLLHVGPADGHILVR